MRAAPYLLRPGAASAARSSVRTSSIRWQSTAKGAATANLSPRWLSDVKQRLGRCVTFGMDSQLTAQAGNILAEIARDWRELMAGSEGFLTSPERRGMYRHEVQWGEMDSMGHVNNVQYNRYAESGRVNWMQKLSMLDPANKKAWSEAYSPRGVGVILRTITTEYKFPMKYPDRISVYHKLRSEPTSSTDAFVLDVVILSELHQRPAARVIEDIVVYDYQKGKKAALPTFMLDVFKQTWKLQEEAKATNSRRVTGLLDQVRQLEQATWDRPDAKEHFGGPQP